MILGNLLKAIKKCARSIYFTLIHISMYFNNSSLSAKTFIFLPHK